MTAFTRGGGNGVWVGHVGSVEQLVRDRDGRVRSIEQLGVGAAARPTAIAVASQDCHQYRFVLDGQSATVLVFAKADPSTPMRRLAVGTGPTGLAVALGGGRDCFLAVANSGSNDISEYDYNARRGFSAERRIPVGVAPRAVIATSDWLVVANSGSGTLTVLDPYSHFKRVGTLRVGGAPSVLAAGQIGGPAGRGSDLVVGDASSSQLEVWFGDYYARTGFKRGPLLELPSAAGRPSALAAGDLNDDKRQDVLVGDAVTGSVVAFETEGRKRALGRGRTVLADVAAVGIAAGPYGGDFHRDVAAADSRTDTIRFVITPGDPLVALSGRVRDLTAGGGRLVWSRWAGTHRYRLVIHANGVTADVPIAPSQRLLRPRLGRLGPQRPAVAYVACRRSRCAPFTWDIKAGRERRLAMPPHTGCVVREVAVWDRWTVFAERRSHNRPCKDGIWEARNGHFTRRKPILSRDTLGDLRRGRLLRAGYLDKHGIGWELLAGRPGLRGSRRLTNMSEVDEGWPSDVSGSRPVLSGGYAYFTFAGEDFVEISRIRITGPCQAQTFSDATTVPLDATFNNFAVDGGRVYYADTTGIWQIDPSRLHWHHDSIWCLP